MITWPPQVGHVRSELGRRADDDTDNDLLATALDAAIAFVTRIKRSTLNVDLDPLNPLPTPDGDVTLGTVRLAIRWHTRRRSPDGLVVAGELGTSRVPSFDPDIDRLLGLGRYAGPVIA